MLKREHYELIFLLDGQLLCDCVKDTHPLELSPT